MNNEAYLAKFIASWVYDRDCADPILEAVYLQGQFGGNTIDRLSLSTDVIQSIDPEGVKREINLILAAEDVLWRVVQLQMTWWTPGTTMLAALKYTKNYSDEKDDLDSIVI